MKKILKIFLYVIGSIVLIILVSAAILWIKSPGTADPITDAKGDFLTGSISTIERIEIGGIDQYLIIRGEDTRKPFMLFLHGGPGSPEFAFMKTKNRELEKEFVMVYWEQRGAGKSYNENIPAESMNIDQFISDTKEVTENLIKRFGNKKIFLMGHSWGSMLGILTAHKYPQLYHAYFGIGQVANQYAGEQISFEWVKEQAKIIKDEQAIKELSEIHFPDQTAESDAWFEYIMTERKYVSKFGGGVTREIKGMWPIIKIILNTKEYTLTDKINGLKASVFSLEHLWPEIVNKNLFNEIDSMQVPVYIFQGKYDYHTPYSIAKEFYDQLKAPQKAFFSFENSAHSPLMEETEKFNALIKKILKQNSR